MQLGVGLGLYAGAGAGLHSFRNVSERSVMQHAVAFTPY